MPVSPVVTYTECLNSFVRWGQMLFIKNWLGPLFLLRLVFSRLSSRGISPEGNGGTSPAWRWFSPSTPKIEPEMAFAATWLFRFNHWCREVWTDSAKKIVSVLINIWVRIVEIRNAIPQWLLTCKLPIIITSNVLHRTKQHQDWY